MMGVILDYLNFIETIWHLKLFYFVVQQLIHSLPQKAKKDKKS